MDEPKLWREILFLLIPLIVMVSLAMMIGCSQNSLLSEAGKDSRISSEDPYASLQMGPEDKDQVPSKN